MTFPGTEQNSPALAGAEQPVRTGLAMIVIMAGVLMTAVDTTIVVLALPEIQRSLHVALSDVVWVIISFLLVITLLATQVGRLGDMFGRVRMYETGFAVFVLGSLLCALAWDEVSIIVFRVVQGIGGALIMANSGAVIADLYPREQRGRAYGFTSLGWTIGAVLGVVLGGLIVTYVSWRWIFWINVPTGVLAIAGAMRVLRDKGERTRQRLDPLGMVTLGLGLFGVLWAITKLGNEPFDASTAGFLIGGVVLIAVFVLIESRVAAPMLPLRIFKVPTMSASLCASLFQGLASFAVLFLLLMYLQGPRGLSPIHASLLLLPGYLISAGVSIYAGRLADKYGAVLPATAGLGLQVVALVLYAQLSNATPLWWIVCIGVINAVGRVPVLPGQQLGDHEGGTAGHVRHRVRDDADLCERRDGVLVLGGHPGGVAVDLTAARVRDLRGYDLAARAGGVGVHHRPARGVLRVGVLHGDRRDPVCHPRRREEEDAYSHPFLMLSTASSPGAVPSSPARTLSSIMPATPDDRGCHVLEAGRVGGVGDVLRNLRPVEDSRQVGELACEPAERVL